jgi:hypothetical protein
LPLLSMPHGARGAVLAVAVLGAGLVATSTAAAAPPSLEVVTGGLANPRGLTVGPDGQIWVAEAGSGGTGACITGPEGGQSCYGPTGAITTVDPRSGARKQVVSGLPSLAAPSGATAGHDAIGPQDVSFGRRGAFFTVGLGADPAVRDTLGDAGGDFAWLYRLGRHGVKKIADLGAYEAENNPDGNTEEGGVDTNPFSVDATGRQLLVSDAGGNDLLGVSKKRGHEIVTLATFAGGVTPFPDLGPMAPPDFPPPGTPVPYQAVPTGVVRGPDGAAYLGQLTGFPFPVGAANVFRVAGQGEPQVIASGFTTIVDIGYHDGNGYVLQISSNGLLAPPPLGGKLIQIAPDGTQTDLAAGRLEQPTGMTIAPNGDIYVSNNGGSPKDGEIVRISAASDDHGGRKHGKKHRKHRQ